MIIGCHVGMKDPDMLLGSVKTGIEWGADCIMVYTGAPQNTIRRSINELKINEAKALSSMEIIVHAPYIVNMANPEKHDFAVSFLVSELKRAHAMGAKQMVLHPGSAVNCERSEAVCLIAKGIDEICEKTAELDVKIALETMSGKGNEIGIRFEEIKAIIDLVKDKKRLSVCFDTCHVHDAGYDIKNHFSNVMEDFDNIIGLQNISVFHINDSKNECGAHKDRHENIGLGYIGFDALYQVVHDNRFLNVPKVLETPYVNDLPPYQEEIKRLRGIEY